jgi:hypothetical protein
MREETDEVARLDERIADLRRRIEEAQERDIYPWGGSERMKILDLLNKTLKDLETSKGALEAPKP